MGGRSAHRRDGVRKTPRTLTTPRQPLTLPELKTGSLPYARATWVSDRPPVTSPELALRASLLHYARGHHHGLDAQGS